MSELTPEARLRLERYVARMRSALRASRAVETAEIEQNVREHVEVAFADAAGPVDAERLDAVLAQLGPPDQWLSEDEQPWWRRIAARVSHGPEDWRLAYLTFGAFALGLLLLPVGIGVFLLVAAFFLGRAACELIESRGENLGARRWIVLPPIWLFALTAAFLLLILPAIGFGAFGISDGNIHLLRAIPRTTPESAARVRVETGYIAAVAGLWWLVFSPILALIMNPLRTLFLPVTQNLGRKHALLLALIGAMVAAIGAVLLFAF